MGIGYSRKSRRQFLIGSGQTLLALPFLPSLLPSYAQGQTAISTNRMMNFIFNHHNEEQWWPARSIATTAVGSIGVRERLLSGMGTSASTVISPLLNNTLYNSLLTQNQITLMRGFDVHISDGSGHVTRAMGGHVVDEFGNSSTNPNHRSTFDYIVETSPTVYPGTSAGITKAIRVDLHGGWTFVQRVGARSSNPNPYGYSSISDMYRDVFSGLSAGTVNPSDMTNTRKTNILNRVFPAFQTYRNSRRISAEDRTRLDQHLSLISDLQRNYAATSGSAPVSSCQQPAAPSASSNNRQLTYLYIDLLAIAFKCGLTKFGALQFEMQDPVWLPGYTGGAGFHDVIHGGSGLVAQHNAFESFHRFGYNAIADRFLTPLNEQEGSTGRTYVDNMITNCLTGLGLQPSTTLGNHWNWDLQQLSFGSMGGKLRAGRYYAMPNISDQRLPYNTFMMTMLNLMGVPPSEYTVNSANGQGFGYYSGTSAQYGSRIYSPVTETLT